MSDTESPEGWVPAIGHGVTLEEVVERAFDYRGNVTVVRADGARLEGYVFNRNRDVPVPFIQVFDRAGEHLDEGYRHVAVAVEDVALEPVPFIQVFDRAGAGRTPG